MKNVYFIVAFLIAYNSGFAQENRNLHSEPYQEKNIEANKNPFEKFGYEETKIATLSQGKYAEFHDKKHIVKIGSFLYDTRSKKITAILEPENIKQSKAIGKTETTSRFMSIDPLFKEYAYNSPYVFSENSTIAFIELEGLERYFSADGSYLGKMGFSNEMRVVPQSEITAYSTFKTANHGNASPALFDASKQFHNAGAEAQANISKTIYSSVINKGVSLSSVSVNSADDGTGMRMSLGGFDLTIYPNLTNGREYILDDYYNFSNLLYHEDWHRKGIGADGWSHFAITKAQTKHWSFAKSTNANKDYIKGVMRGYLDEDMEGYMSNLIFLSESKETAQSLLNSERFQEIYTQYKENVNYYNKIFNEDYEVVDYQQIIDGMSEKKND